jgi:hypothetical protein
MVDIPIAGSGAIKLATPDWQSDGQIESLVDLMLYGVAGRPEEHGPTV